MIIVFQGTREGKHGTAAAMVTAAAFQMARANKKIAIMSFCDNERKNNIENFAFTADDMPDIGNPLTELGDFEFNDTGIDALVRRSETGVLAKEHFNTCCMPAVKTPNGLDVIGTTSTEHFEDDMSVRFEVAKGVLDIANEMYNFVFVLADPQHEELTRKLDEVADKIVVVIRQAKIDRELSFPKEIQPKVHLLVADYEAESSFGLRYLRNGYKAKTLYALPHSVSYRDACANGAIIRFALRNSALSETPGDINYAFSTAINGLLDRLCGKAETEEELAEKQEQEEEELQTEELKKKKKEKKLHDISEDDVNPVVISKKKKGLFKKKETFERVEIGGKSPLEDGEEITDEDEEETSSRKHGDLGDISEEFEEGGEIRHISAVDADGNEIPVEESAEPEEQEKDADDEEIAEDDSDDNTVSVDPAEDEPEDDDNEDSEEDFDETDDVNEEPEDEEAIEVEPAPKAEAVTESAANSVEGTDMDEPETEEVEDDVEVEEDEDVVEAIPEEPAPKKKGGFFSFFRKKEVNVREADFSKVQYKSVETIEDEIQEALKDYDEKSGQDAAEDLMAIIDDEEPSEESYYNDKEETAEDTTAEEASDQEMYDKDDEPEPVEDKVVTLDDLDEEDEVPVINEAPRKLSRRERRLLRESMQIVKA